jgi:hypothetical protein
MNGGQTGAYTCLGSQGSFGKGGALDSSDDNGGGAGGWYGGCSWGDSDAGGGSPYVFTDLSDKTGYSGNVPDSRFYISNSQIAIGAQSMPDPATGSDITTGRQGDGYAKISILQSPISFDDTECEIQTWSDTQITCITSAHTAGAVEVTVNLSNSMDPTITKVGAFSYASVPDAPVASSTPAGEGTINLTWKPGSDNYSAIKSYTIEYTTDELFTSPESITLDVNDSRLTYDSGNISYKLSGLVNGATYYIRVLATNDIGGNEWSNVVEAMLRDTATEQPVIPGPPNTGVAKSSETCYNVLHAKENIPTKDSSSCQSARV